MTARSLLLRLRCLLPGPTKGRLLREATGQADALRAALIRAHDRHETMRTFAYSWRAELKAAETAAIDAGFAEQTPAAVIYVLAAQLETARRERDAAITAEREAAPA